MFGGSENHKSTEAVALQNAVLCIDCEFVTTSRGDECPVCGGHSLLNLAAPVGGTLLDCKARRMQREKLVLYELRITIELHQMEGRHLSAAVEGITGIIASKLDQGLATLHINVEPTGCGAASTFKAAA